jgi:hypothetical protein
MSKNVPYTAKIANPKTDSIPPPTIAKLTRAQKQTLVTRAKIAARKKIKNRGGAAQIGGDEQ